MSLAVALRASQKREEERASSGEMSEAILRME